MSKAKEQLEQMAKSIRYIFICDYYFEVMNEDLKIERGTIIDTINVSRYPQSNFSRVGFLLGTKIINMPIDDFRFCTKSFDSREIPVD